MMELTIKVHEDTAAYLQKVALKHRTTPQTLAGQIIEHAIDGEDMRLEVRRLRVDIATITQHLLVRSGMVKDPSVAREWAIRELLMPRAK